MVSLCIVTSLITFLEEAHIRGNIMKMLRIAYSKKYNLYYRPLQHPTSEYNLKSNSLFNL